MDAVLLAMFAMLLIAWIVIDGVVIHRHHQTLRDVLFHNLSLHESCRQRITGIYRMLNLQIDDLEEIKRLVSFDKYPRVYLKGETMDGKNLVYTVIQPEKTAGDIKEWTISISRGGEVKGKFTLPIEVQAFDFKVPKGTKGIQVAVFFTDTSENPGEATVSELFDALDTIAPPAPAAVTLTVREETDDDADLPVIATEPNTENPVDTPEETNGE